MEPTLARLERLERDYRRSRLWNRVALLALLVVVCAGFAQQQDPTPVDRLRCKVLEAETIRCQRIEGTRSDENAAGSFMLMCNETGAGLVLRSPDRLHCFQAHVTNGCARFAAEQYSENPEVLDVLQRLRSQVSLVEGSIYPEIDGPSIAVNGPGLSRAVLGSLKLTDAMGRSIHYPVSTLTLLDKNGYVLERLPR